MKKLLLFTISLFGVLNMSAQTDCGTATPITTNGIITSDAFTGGTFQSGCLSNTTGIKTIWYSFTPTSNGEITISSDLADNDGVSYTDDTRISIFSGDCTTMTCMGYNDDISSTNYLSTITVPVAAGVTYYIQWDNYWYVGDTTGLEDLGFVFDFTFDAVSCVRPSAFDFYRPSNYTTTSATLAWDNAVGGPSNYDIDWSTNFASLAGAGTIVSVPAATTTTTGPISGLPNGNNFRYYVRSSCDTANLSAWQGPFYGYLAKTLPYSNSFNSSANNYTDGFIGFSRLANAAATATQAAITADGSTGSLMYTFNSTSAVSNAWAYSRAVSLAAGEVVIITFKTRLWTPTAATAASPMKLDVTVGTNQITTAQTTVLASITETLKTLYTTRTATYTAPTAGIYYFGFHNNSAVGTNQTFLFFDTLNMTSTLSVDAFDESTISIAPNPATEFINVTNSSNNSILNIVLTDLNGRIVKNIKVENKNDNQINISDLSSGIYMMKIVSDKGTSTKKVIKE